MFSQTKRVFLTFFLLMSLPVMAQLTPGEIAQAFKYHEVELSPDGKHIAVVLTQGGKRKMVVLDTTNFKMVGATAFSGQEEVGEVHWVNNERLVIKVVKKRAWLEVPEYYGELYAVDYDGSRAKMIYGFRAGEMQTGSKLKKRKATYGWAYIIDYLKDDEKHILIESVPMTQDDYRYSSVQKLNVYTGILSNPIARAPIKYSTFYTDQHSNLRLVVGKDDENNKRAYKFNDDRSWTEIPEQEFGKAFTPLRFNEKSDGLYIIDNHGQDKAGLFRLNLDTGERTHLYTDADVDITNAVFSADNNKVYAVRVDPGYPAYVIFNSSSEEAKTFKSLINTFAGHRVMITSQSEDGNKLVLLVGSDINPSVFYLYDKKTNNLSMLFNNLGELDQNKLAMAEPISFKARDGAIIHSWLYEPSGRC